MTKKAKHGQFFSTEIILTFSVFVAALMIFLLVWNNLLYSYDEEQMDQRMQMTLAGLSDSLVLTQGDPANWEQGAAGMANSIGLATSRNVLSQAKIDRLFMGGACEDANLRAKMGGYSFFIVIRSANGTVMNSMGCRPSALLNSTVSTATANRVGILNGQVVNMNVVLWRIRGQGI